MIIIIHPKIPLSLEIGKNKEEISLIPFDIESKFKNVKKELGNEYNTKRHKKWYAYLFFKWFIWSFQFNIKNLE